MEKKKKGGGGGEKEKKSIKISEKKKRNELESSQHLEGTILEIIVTTPKATTKEQSTIQTQTHKNSRLPNTEEGEKKTRVLKRSATPAQSYNQGIGAPPKSGLYTCIAT